jgi:hypothetical protein
MTIKINERPVRQIYEQFGEKIQRIVNDTARETAEQPLEGAVESLHLRLSASGVQQERSWSEHALTTLRAGEPLELRLT